MESRKIVTLILLAKVPLKSDILQIECEHILRRPSSTKSTEHSANRMCLRGDSLTGDVFL